MIDLDLFPIHQETLPWQPILDKIGKMSLIWQAGVPKWLRICDSKTFNGNIAAT